MTLTYDHDRYMRLHALAAGRVTVTDGDHPPRNGRLLGWAPRHALVHLDGAQRPLTLRLRRYGVEPVR